MMNENVYIDASLYYELSRRGVSVTNQSCVLVPAEGNFHTLDDCILKVRHVEGAKLHSHLAVLFETNV